MAKPLVSILGKCPYLVFPIGQEAVVLILLNPLFTTIHRSATFLRGCDSGVHGQAVDETLVKHGIQVVGKLIWSLVIRLQKVGYPKACVAHVCPLT
jgi:hypothetical protein